MKIHRIHKSFASFGFLLSLMPCLLAQDTLTVEGNLVVEEELRVDGALEVSGSTRVEAVIDSTSWSSGSAPALFTPLGRFSVYYPIFINATATGCGNGAGVTFYIAPSYLSHGAAVKVYTLGDNDGWPSGETRFRFWVAVDNNSYYYLAAEQVGGCSGSGSKNVRYVIRGLAYDTELKLADQSQYVQHTTYEYLHAPVDASSPSTFKAQSVFTHDPGSIGGKFSQIGNAALVVEGNNGSQEIAIDGNEIIGFGDGGLHIQGEGYLRLKVGNNDATGGVNPGGVVEALSIDDAGRVGIGTTGPQAELDVNGSANVSGDLTVSGTISLPTTYGDIPTYQPAP